MTSAAGLPALNRFDINTWDEVIAVLQRHGFEVAEQTDENRARRSTEAMWLVTSSKQAGITLVTDTQLLYFAMGLAAAEA